MGGSTPGSGRKKVARKPPAARPVHAITNNNELIPSESPCASLHVPVDLIPRRECESGRERRRSSSRTIIISMIIISSSRSKAASFLLDSQSGAAARAAFFPHSLSLAHSLACLLPCLLASLSSHHHLSQTLFRPAPRASVSPFLLLHDCDGRRWSSTLRSFSLPLLPLSLFPASCAPRDAAAPAPLTLTRDHLF